MATHSSILAWRIPWMEEPGGLLSIGSHWIGQRLKWLSMHACIGEGNGYPLQYSCLENPRDGGAWWAAIYGVSQSQTGLKRLSSSRAIPLDFKCMRYCFKPLLVKFLLIEAESIFDATKYSEFTESFACGGDYHFLTALIKQHTEYLLPFQAWLKKQ